MKRILAFTLGAVFAWSAQADTLKLNPNYPSSYTVVRGDTLWDIAGRFLQNPWQWPEIWRSNTDVVEDPHWIYPGELLVLRHDDSGQPYITRDTSGLQTVRLSPEVKISDFDRAITTVPLESIRPFLSEATVMTEAQLEAAPYVFAHEQEELLSNNGEWTYARGNNKAWQEGAEYTIVRKSDPYISLDGDVLGIEAQYVGRAVVEKVRGDVAALEVLTSDAEIRTGDRLMPDDIVSAQMNFMPAPANRAVTLLRGLTASDKIATYDAAVIDAGANKGIQPGQVFEIFNAGDSLAYDRYNHGELTGEMVNLPEKPKGTAMVFRVFDQVAYVLIMSSTQPVEKMDVLAPPY